MSTKFTDSLIETKSDRMEWGSYRTSRDLIHSIKDQSYRSLDRNIWAPNDQVIIQVQDDNAWIDLLNSYLRFTISVTGPTGLGESPNDETRIRHAFDVLSTLTIASLKTGTELERIDYVNRWTNLITRCSLEKDYAETIGHMFGMFDVAGILQNNTVFDQAYPARPADGAPSQAVRAWVEACKGEGYINDESNCTSDAPNFWKAGSRLSREFDVCIPLFLISGFCNQDKYVNLRALGGLEFRFNLESSVKALISDHNDTYTIVNPRIQARLLQMDPTITKKYLDEAKGSKGVSLYFQSVQGFQEAFGAGTKDLQRTIHCNKGSAVAVFHVMTLNSDVI